MVPRFRAGEPGAAVFHGALACAQRILGARPTAADDAHLSDREKTEERVGSVDHDVWACPSCGRVEKVRGNALFTRYAACPTCGAQTAGMIETVLRAATTSEEGLVKVSGGGASGRW